MTWRRTQNNVRKPKYQKFSSCCGLPEISGSAHFAQRIDSPLYLVRVSLTSPKLDAPLARRWLREAWTARSLFVALFVGSILNLINQGDALLSGSVNWPKIVLTYFVPLAVVSYGAAGKKE